MLKTSCTLIESNVSTIQSVQLAEIMTMKQLWLKVCCNWLLGILRDRLAAQWPDDQGRLLPLLKILPGSVWMSNREVSLWAEDICLSPSNNVSSSRCLVFAHRLITHTCSSTNLMSCPITVGVFSHLWRIMSYAFVHAYLLKFATNFHTVLSSRGDCPKAPSSEYRSLNTLWS